MLNEIDTSLAITILFQGDRSSVNVLMFLLVSKNPPGTNSTNCYNNVEPVPMSRLLA